jgi:hypothetical protein
VLFRSSQTQTQCDQDHQLKLHVCLMGDPPGRLSGDMRKHVLETVVTSEERKTKCQTRKCQVCAKHKKGVKPGTSVSSA